MSARVMDFGGEAGQNVLHRDFDFLRRTNTLTYLIIYRHSCTTQCHKCPSRHPLRAFVKSNHSVPAGHGVLNTSIRSPT